ncbi:MAG: GNAT family N-acetyltransferase [Bdellovibrionales bacterium]
MLRIRKLRETDLEALLEFTDREIGLGYFNGAELRIVYERSQSHGHMCSFVLVDRQSSIHGIRLSYPPGRWDAGKGLGLRPDLWPYPLQATAYFQSIFLTPEVQGLGWGGRLSREALAALKRTGAKGVVTHAWKESPHGSSTRYLSKLGFETLIEHPEYWRDVPYDCTRCLRPPCLCTAIEMYLDLYLDRNLDSRT